MQLRKRQQHDFGNHSLFRASFDPQSTVSQGKDLLTRDAFETAKKAHSQKRIEPLALQRESSYITDSSLASSTRNRDAPKQGDGRPLWNNSTRTTQARKGGYLIKENMNKVTKNENEYYGSRKVFSNVCVRDFYHKYNTAGTTVFQDD